MSARLVARLCTQVWDVPISVPNTTLCSTWLYLCLQDTLAFLQAIPSWIRPLPMVSLWVLIGCLSQTAFQVVSTKVLRRCFGGCAAFIGAIAYLGPKAGRDVFGISGEMADLVFGAVTVLTGVFGTLAGGVLLDRMGSTMGNALTICAAGMAFG